jgi:hypothetical protein
MTEADLESLRSSIDAVSLQLAAAGGDPDRLRKEHAVALERLGQRFDARFDALARVQAVIGELRELTSRIRCCRARRRRCAKDRHCGGRS